MQRQIWLLQVLRLSQLVSHRQPMQMQKLQQQWHRQVLLLLLPRQVLMLGSVTPHLDSWQQQVLLSLLLTSQGPRKQQQQQQQLAHPVHCNKHSRSLACSH